MAVSLSDSPMTDRSTGRATGPVRFGVVGCGWVARDYGLPGLIVAGEVTHLCDADAEAAAICAAGVEAATDRLPRVTASLDELLADDAVEAVYVATPNHTHAAIVSQCAAAGKAVLCEKPLAESVASAQAMVDACERHGVLLATAYDQRWHPAHRAIRKLIAAGRLGTVTQARIHYACWLPAGWSPDGRPHDNWRVDAARAGGGAGIDLAPHGVDLLATLLDCEWDTLQALTQTAVQDYTTDDGAVLMGRLGDTLATLHVGYNCPDPLPRRQLELIGTAGRIDAVNTMGQTPGGQVTFTDAETGQGEPVAFDAAASPFAEQARWFADAVRGRADETYPAATDLARHTLLLDALNAALNAARSDSP